MKFFNRDIFRKTRVLGLPALGVVLALMLFLPAQAYAACTSPTAPDGVREWFSGENTYKFCIGSTWVAVKDEGSLGACSDPMRWDYDTGATSFKQCAGSVWRKVGCNASSGPWGAGSSFNSNYPNCTANAGGALTLAGALSTGFLYIDVASIWADDGYVFFNDLNYQKLRAFAFNGSGFVLLDSKTVNAGYSMWGDGNYLYVADYGLPGLRAYSFDGKVLTVVGSVTASEEINSIWGDGTYIYINDLGVLRAYTFNGTSFTLRGSITLSDAKALWANGSHIFVTRGNAGLYAYTFNGTTFTQAGFYDSPGVAYDVFGVGSTIYLTDTASGLRALTFNGSSFTSLGSYSDGNDFFFLWADGTRIYVNTETGFRAFTFNGSSFTQVTSYGTVGATSIGKDVWGDGTTVYLASGAPYAFSGSGCTSPAGPGNPLVSGASCASVGACSSAGRVDYDAANSRVQYCNGTNWYPLAATGSGGGGTETGANPVWVTPSTQIAETYIGTVGDLFVYATDESGIVTYSKVSGPSWFTISAAGKIMGTPPAGGGNQSIVVRAQDGAGHFVDRTFIVYASTKVLCTYYNSRGMIADSLFAGDLAYADMIDPQVGRAYRAWANPLIGWLKQNEGSFADRVVFSMVQAWAQEMAYRTGYAEEGNTIGWLFSEIGEPLHYLAGYFVPEDDVERSIREQLEERRKTYHIAQADL